VTEPPAPREELVRRCVIALLGATFDAPPSRCLRSPAFARRVDAALAGADSDVPVEVREPIAARLAEHRLPMPTSVPSAPGAVDARALRTMFESLDALSSGDERLPPRIAAAYRAQGASAYEVVATIALEFAIGDAGAILEVAMALDRAGELLQKTWEPGDLRLALERELRARPQPVGIEPERPHLVAPEPARPLPGRRYQSASSLNLYAECPRKWYFKYLCGAVEEKPTSASAYGTAFHAALEAFHRIYPCVEGAARRDLEQRLEGEVNAAFEQYRIHFGSEVEFRLNRRRAQRTARKYLTWLHERAAKEPFEVIGCELKADINLDGVDFRGYIDRVDRDKRSGRVTVFDYKTGSIAESAAEYRKKINDRKEFQLPYYYWAQTLSGETVRSLALVPLREAHLDIAPIELDVVPSAAPSKATDESPRGVISLIELERARTAMVELGRKLSATTDARFEATRDPAPCRYCVYAPACRERPPDHGHPFAR
jgi:RecB family exonuclease